MSAENSTTAPAVRRPENPALWLKPDEPLMAGGYDWSWCYVMFGEVRGFPQYRVTDRGIVYSRRTRVSPTPHWTALKPKTTNNGHRYVNLSHQNKTAMLAVHRLVLEAFVGASPKGMEACHDNGDPSDNRLSNLRWDTHKNNMRDKYSHDTVPLGERHHNSRLTEAIVREIRGRLEMNSDRRVIADEFGISMQHVHKIYHRILWPHV